MKKLILISCILIFLVSCEPSERAKLYRENAQKQLNSGKLSFTEAYDSMSRYNLSEGKFTDSEGHLHKIFALHLGTDISVLSTEDDPKCPVCYGIFD